MEFTNYLLYSIYSLLIIFLAFFVPGNILLTKIKLSPVVKFSSSILLGVSMWALQGFLLGYLGLRNLTYLYLILSLVVWLKINYKNLKIPRLTLKKEQIRQNYLLIAVFVIGVVLQLVGSIGNAVPVNSGLSFCCGGADTLYHTALSKELIRNFPPYEPAVANYELHNYHFLSNLVVSETVRVFNLPLFFTQFRLIPVFMSVMLGLAAYCLASLLSKSKSYRLFFLILTFFFSDILYLLTLLTTRTLAFDAETIETSLSLWVSYTRYFGVVFFFQALTFLVLWLKNKRLPYFIPLLLTAGTLIGFKVYIGLLFLAGLGFLSIYFLLKKEVKPFLSIVGIFALSFLIYFPVNSGSGGLVFTGFWRTRDFIVNPFLGLHNLELARRVFESAGNPKSYIFDILFFFVYVFFSFGILLTSFLNPLRRLRTIDAPVNIFLLSGLLTTFIVAMFFIQKTGGANSGQFLISVFLIGIVYASLFLDGLWKSNKILLKLLVIALLLLMLPKTINTALAQAERIKQSSAEVITNDTLLAFDYINSNLSPGSVVIMDPALQSSCLALPIMTHAESYFCSGGAPEDRGIKAESYRTYVWDVLRGKKVANKGFDYVLATKSAEITKGQGAVYQNASLKILIYE